MVIDKTTYRANDIRGIADTQLSDDFCTLTALAYVELLRKHRHKEPQELTVVLGKDVRNSSPRIKNAFAHALISRGVHVIDIAPLEKVSSTPMMYFATWLFNADGGVEVTGSHLDKEWNGFKLCVGSESTTSTQISEMFKTAKKLEGMFKTGSLSSHSTLKGELVEVDVLKDYQHMIAANVILRARWEELALRSLSGKISLQNAISIALQEIEKLPEERREPLTGLKIVYDAGNGTTGVKNAHIGLSSDCDGDRAGAVSPGGRNIIGEQILALLCKHILKEHPHAKIVYDTKCSDAIREIIVENGGVPVEWKTGFSFIKTKMDAVNAVAGGEMSGHVYFQKNNRADDAVFAFSELLLLTAAELRFKKSVDVVDEMLADFLKRYVNTPEIRIPVVSDEEKEQVCDAVENYYRELAAKNPEKYRRRTDEAGNDIDGVKIYFIAENGWALVRRSNTSPVIILRMEARNAEGLRKIEEHVISKFEKVKTVDLKADDYLRKIVQRLKLFK